MALHATFRKSFPEFALEVSLSAEQETLGLLGSSGCGKSMTLRCIAGIVRPDEGHIELDGTVLYDSVSGIDLPPQKRQVGYLFQHYALFPTMTVWQNLKCGLRGRQRGAEAQITDILERFYLTGLERRYPAQLSGGQQQRVALARMLLSEPRILLLDEPFSALDTYLRGEMEREMAGLLREFAGPALLVSHNRDEIYHLCDRIAVYYSGGIDVMGDKKEVFDRPMTVNAAILTGCRNVLPAEFVDEHHLRVPAWNIILRSAECVSEEINAVGVRAHYFHLANGSEENVVVCCVDSVTESPFELVAYLRPLGGTGLLCWKTPKEVFRRVTDPSRIALAVQEKDVLVLTDGKKEKEILEKMGM